MTDLGASGGPPLWPSLPLNSAPSSAGSRGLSSRSRSNHQERPYATAHEMKQVYPTAGLTGASLKDVSSDLDSPRAREPMLRPRFGHADLGETLKLRCHTYPTHFRQGTRAAYRAALGADLHRCATQNAPIRPNSAQSSCCSRECAKGEPWPKKGARTIERRADAPGTGARSPPRGPTLAPQEATIADAARRCLHNAARPRPHTTPASPPGSGIESPPREGHHCAQGRGLRTNRWKAAQAETQCEPWLDMSGGSNDAAASSSARSCSAKRKRARHHVPNAAARPEPPRASAAMTMAAATKPTRTMPRKSEPPQTRATSSTRTPTMESTPQGRRALRRTRVGTSPCAPQGPRGAGRPGGRGRDCCGGRARQRRTRRCEERCDTVAGRAASEAPPPRRRTRRRPPGAGAVAGAAVAMGTASRP